MKTNETLALRYRPTTLGGVVGHTSVVTTLKGMFKERNIPNAFMLTGPTGVGKTTLSRMIARYLNCEKLSSCGKCDSCLDMDKEDHADYQEVNGSTKGNKADVQELIDSASFQPTCNIRIMAIDEAHRMSYAGVQALLKPLEEPPSRTLWIISTSEPDRIPNSHAVRGRCMVFNLERPGKQEISDHLLNIAKKEKLKWATEPVVEVVTEASNGQVRDAVQILENAANHVAGLDKPLKKKGDYVDLIGNLSLEVTTTELDHSALILLSGMYSGDAANVQGSILETEDYVGLLNKCLSINSYHIGRTILGSKHKNLWHTRVNTSFRSVLKDANVDPKDMNMATLIHQRLLRTKDELMKFSTAGGDVLTAWLTGFVYEDE